MATTVSTDVKVYDRQFQGGFVEQIQQNVAAFNEQSAGAIVLRNRIIPGSYEKEAFWDEVSSISRRDPTNDSSSSASSTKLTQDEFIGVKLDRRNGPYESNIDSFRKIGADWSREKSRVIGIQTAAAMPQEQLDRALGALEAKLDGTTALENDKASTGTMKTEYLVQALAKFGDKAGQLAVWVMHSKAYFDLVEDQLADAVYRVNGTLGTQIVNGTPATLNRPVLLTDSASLKEDDAGGTGTHHYSTLGLTRGAAILEVSAPPIAVMEGPITGSDNLFVRWQAEYSYNLRLRGCAWNTGTGANPTNSNVANASNWTTKVADNKLLPGVIVKTQ